MPREKWTNPSGSREYFAWRSMRSRCLSKKNTAWENYGGRGITVCERWVKDYDAFFSDMGPCPERMTLDRIDPEKGYSPENCRWADWTTQANNKRTNIKIEFEGQTKTAAQWAKHFGLKANTLFKRLERMGPEKAFTSENLVEKNAMPLTHGTRSGYDRHKCRCDICKAANAKRHLDYMKSKNKSAIAGEIACMER